MFDKPIQDRPQTPEELVKERNFWETEMRKLEFIWDEEDLCDIDFRHEPDEDEIRRQMESDKRFQENIKRIAKEMTNENK